VGHVSDHGRSRGGRRVALTLWQEFPATDLDPIRHRLLFEGEEAERILSLVVRGGDRIRADLDGERPKAYLAGEGGEKRLVPFLESYAYSAVLLLKSPDPGFGGRPPRSSRSGEGLLRKGGAPGRPPGNGLGRGAKKRGSSSAGAGS
jgi:hypothetical protein